MEILLYDDTFEGLLCAVYYGLCCLLWILFKKSN